MENHGDYLTKLYSAFAGLNGLLAKDNAYLDKVVISYDCSEVEIHMTIGKND